MNDFYRIAKVLEENKGYRHTLATVIGVNGSSYRRIGAKMLFREDGKVYGLLSGGCLEHDLAHLAAEVITDNLMRVAVYDLRSEDDLSWGQGTGCNGKIRVLLEPAQWNEEWAQACRALDVGETLLYARRADDRTAPVRSFLRDDGRSSPDRAAAEAFAGVERGLRTTDGKRTRPIETGEAWFVERIAPRERLLVFGAGSDAEPLVELASRADFAVTVIDPREMRCNAGFFPQAAGFAVEHAEPFVNGLAESGEQYVLLMTHHFQRDRILLQYFISNRPRYLGVLGPKARTGRLLDPDPVPEWVRTPVGLPIGAEGPEEIAISIVGQLIEARKHR